MSSARSILSIVGADRLDRFNDELTRFSRVELGTQFASVRRLVSKSLLDASPEGYGWLHELHAPDEMLKQMVENSSEVLRALRTKYTLGT